MQKQLNILLHEIQEYNVDHFHSSHQRNKRGLLNVVGEIAKNLFGTLSETDSENFLTKFQTIYKENQLRDEITNKQTTLIQSSLNLIAESRNDSETRDKQLQSQILTINNTLHKFQQNTYNFAYTHIIKSQTQDMMTFIILLLISFQAKQKHFLEALSLGTKGANSPIIIPPEVFFKELSLIRTALSGQGIDLPISLTKDTLSLFYQITSPRSRLIHNQLIISLTIPLTDMEEYNLFKVTSFPHRLPNNLYHFIIPQHEYVAISRYRQKYISFTNQELANCHTIYLTTNQSLLTCMQLTPVMDITVDRDNCEITLLTKDSKNCNIRIANISSEIWLKLRQSNSWIYVLPSTQMVHIGCKGQPVYNNLLSGTGILTIHEDCNIKTDKILIQAFKIYQKEVFKEIQPYGRVDVDIKSIMTELTYPTKAQIKIIDAPSVITFGQNDKLKEASTSLKELTQMEDALKHKYTPSSLRQGITTITTLIIIIIIIILIIIARAVIKKIRRRQRRIRYIQKVLEAQGQTEELTKQEDHHNEQLLYPTL